MYVCVYNESEKADPIREFLGDRSAKESVRACKRERRETVILCLCVDGFGSGASRVHYLGNCAWDYGERGCFYFFFPLGCVFFSLVLTLPDNKTKNS